MAEMENEVFPILEAQERVFAKVFAVTKNPVEAMKAAGVIDSFDVRLKQQAKQWLANPAIQKAVLEETTRFYKSKKFDKIYMLEKMEKVLDHCIGVENNKMRGASEAIKAADLMSKIQGLYDSSLDGSMKQLAQINIQVNNNNADSESRRI